MRRLLGEFCDLVLKLSIWLGDADCCSDYATWTNLQNNVTSNAMVCDYKMVSV
jgi:hypothetical protein